MSETSSIPPAAVRLVRDFVNTVEWQVDEDAWQTPSDLADWFAENTDRTRHALNRADLDFARRTREGLREVLLSHAGHEPLQAAVDDLNQLLSAVPLRMDFDSAGSVRLSANSAAGFATWLGPILEAITTSAADGSWCRLKACSRDSCRWAYWDSSRNQSGRWCSMAGCGNYIKMRRRNSAVRSPGEVIPTAFDGSRVPRLIDVAARAGVSIKTVSNVANGYGNVAEETRRRVQAVIDELGYRPNLVARELRSTHPTRPPATAPDGE
ncbi:LacI family DNA-binding transcriptional regulator [Microbacter sp. GSS18]|nr:LacI family DNA-binding transcriptional regulator [Microbacter sp. GSS18]